MKVHQKEKWGFLRETSEKAQKAGIDSDTGLHRTGLEEYLRVIFPEISKEEWIHDKGVPGSKSQTRPDYRCESLNSLLNLMACNTIRSQMSFVRMRLKTICTRQWVTK